MQGSMKKVSQLKAEVLAGVEQMPPEKQELMRMEVSGPLYVMCSLYYEAHEESQDGDGREFGWPWLP